MSTLTPKQEKFAQCVADGMTQADAYRNSYNAKKMKPSTVMESASRLMADCNISARVKELQAELSAKALWTREKSARFYLSVLENESGEYKSVDQIAAAKQLDKTHGFEQAKVDVTTNGESINAIDRAAALAAVANGEATNK